MHHALTSGTSMKQLSFRHAALSLTLSNPVMPDGYTSKHPRHTGLTQHFQFLKFRHSGARQSTRMSEIENGGFNQYGTLNALVDSFLLQTEKCGNERVN